MAIIKPVFTENVNLHSSATLSFGASATDDIDLDNLGADSVVISISIAFGGTPDDDCIVEIFASSDSGNNDDTVAVATLTIANVVSTTERRTFRIAGMPYITVKVTNNDTTDDVTYEAHFAWRQWTSV